MGTKLYFRVAIEDIKRRLDEQKQAIKQWTETNPILLQVKVQSSLSALEGLKTQLKQVGAVFGENNAQVQQLGKEIEQVSATAVSHINKMSSASQKQAAAQVAMTAAKEDYLAALQKEIQLKDKIANNDKNIADAQRRISTLKNDPSATSAMAMKGYERQIEVWREQNRKLNEELQKTAEQRNRFFEAFSLAKGVDAEMRQLTERTTGQQRYNAMLADTEKLLQRVKNASSMPGSSPALQVGVRDITAFLEKAAAGAKYKDEPAMVSNLITEYQRLLRVYGAIVTEQEKMAKASDAAATKEAKRIQQETAERQKATQAIRAQAEALLRTRQETLRSQSTDLGKLLRLGEKGLGTEQYAHVRDALRAIRQELREIDAIMQRGGRSSSLMLSLGGNARDYSHVIATAQQYANIRVQGERDMTTAVQQSTSALSQQSQVMSDLKTMAQQYVSLWAAQNFVSNIIEQGGQLEQQRLSIQAILQDGAQARELFGKIKALAPASPFDIVEIDRMSKQLTAYGFQYHELYDMTKRLGDISAATGTDVGRLALALGHVRSEGALSGYTLRQFAMGNVPLLQKLTEKLGITAKEVRKLVSKKEIGYDEVLEILKELTDEGGMFYKAQETMAEALNAKFKNLRDTFSVMYSEMAEGSVGDVLKNVAQTLTNLSRNWKILMPMLLAAAGAMGVQKLATMALNHELMAQERYIGRNAIATSKYSAAQLRAIATTGRWTLALRGLGRAIASMGKFIFSPVTLGFAAVEGLIYLWQKHNQEMEKAEELTKLYSLAGKEASRNLKSEIDNIEPFVEGMSESKLKQGIDQMTETLMNYGISRSEIFKTAFGADEESGKVKSLADQYQYLSEQMDYTRQVYQELERTAGAFEFGIKHTAGGWLEEGVETDLTEYSNQMKAFYDAVTEYGMKYGKAIENSVNAAVAADPVFAEATANMSSYIEKLAVFWSNPEKFTGAAEKMNSMFGGSNPDDAEKVTESFFGYINAKNEAAKELDLFFTATEARLKEQGYDFQNLTQVQIDNLLKQTRDWIGKHPEWNNIIKDIEEKINRQWPAINFSLEPEMEDLPENLQDWQIQMKEWLDAHGLSIKIKPTSTRKEIIQMVHDMMGDAQTAIDQTKPILLRFKADLSNLQHLPAGLQTPWGTKQAKDYASATTTYDTGELFLQQFGLPQPKENTTKSRKEDKQLKTAKTHLEEVKSFLSEYKKYREVYGKERAINMLEELFPTTKSKGREIVENFKGVLGEIKASISLTTDERKKFGIGIDKLIADTDLEEAKDALNRQMKEMEQYISDNAEKFNLYHSLLEKTNDKTFAMGAFVDGQIWDDAARSLAESLREKMGELGGLVDWDADKQAAEDWFKANFANGDSLFKLWESIVDMIHSNYVDSLKESAEATAALMTEEEKIANIEREIAELRKKGKTDSSPEIIKKNMELEQARSEAFKKSTNYLYFYNSILSMSVDQAEKIGQQIKVSLVKEMRNGTISAKQYSQEVKRINDQMIKLRSKQSDFSSFMSGGLKGLYQGKYDSAESDFNKASTDYLSAAQQYSKALERGDEASMQQAQNAMDAAQSMQDGAAAAMNGAQGAMQTIGVIDRVVHGVNDIVQGLYAAFNQIKEMYDALGHDTGTDAWTDWETFFSSFSKASSSLTKAFDSAKSGNIGGVIDGAIGSVTSWITGFAEGHDKKQQHHIDALKRNADALEQNTDAIKSARERTLGYDYGTLRRRMASQYEDYIEPDAIIPGIYHRNAVKQAMQDYYNQNSEGSGYSQEFNNLKDTREKYMRMYEEEDEKKKKSQDALDEYKQKIAELDEQIAFYVEDLANELWGIDIKAWAEQISDALWTAFENGEDALDAFHDAAKDIISDVAKRMMNIHLIEPVFEKLEDALFGKIGKNGQRTGGAAYNYSTGEFDEEATLKILGKFFDEDGDLAKAISTAQSFYEMAQRATGYDFADETSSSSSGGSGIQGITEETANLLSSYVNAVRADVSIIRELDARVVQEFWPSQIRMMTSANDSLTSIRQHAKETAINTLAIKKSTERMADLMEGLRSKTWRIPIS